jgi:hypothetical protein
MATVVPVLYSVWFGQQWLGWTTVLSFIGAAVCLGIGVTTLAYYVAQTRPNRPASQESRPRNGRERRKLAVGVVCFLAAAALALILVVLQVDKIHNPQPSGPGLDQFLPLSDGVTSTLLTAIPVMTILLIRRALKNPETRRHIGTAWDVATFWPRPFHPLAPPSYAERAVPELRYRIQHLLDENKAVLLLGHSQGAVLTAAALAQLAREQPADQLGRLSVITYGNPLRRLYMRWFPEYTGRVLDHLGLGDPASADCQAGPRLVNFHRLTDPIGRNLFNGTSDGRERWLPDPPIDGHRRGDGEPLVRGHAHGGYVKQYEFREYVAAEIDRLDKCAREARRNASNSGPTGTMSTEVPRADSPFPA